MPFTPNRRSILRSGARLVGGCAAALVVDGARSNRRAGDRVAAQDDAPLVVAMLDSHAERLEPLIEAASEEHGAEIDLVPLSYGELYRQLSLALTQRSTSFDVVSLDDSWVPQFASFLAPISVAPSSSDLILPIATGLASYPADALACGLPWLGDAQFFVSRPNWLQRSGEAAPQSWDDTTDTAASLTATLDADEDQAAFALSTLTPHAMVDSFLPILRGCGKELIDPDTSVPQLDTPQALEAIAIFQSLAALSPVESAATGEPTNAERFEAGVVAMMSNFWTSSLLAAGEVETARNAGPIDCALQPAQTGIERQSMPAIWIAGIPVGSERPDRAHAFVEWLVSPATQRAMVEVSLPPVYAPVFVDDALVDRQPHLPQLLDLLAGSTPRPRSPYYPQLELLLATELASVLKGEKSGEQAMRDANIAMRTFLAREGVLVA